MAHLCSCGAIGVVEMPSGWYCEACREGLETLRRSVATPTAPIARASISDWIGENPHWIMRVAVLLALLVAAIAGLVSAHRSKRTLPVVAGVACPSTLMPDGEAPAALYSESLALVTSSTAFSFGIADWRPSPWELRARGSSSFGGHAPKCTRCGHVLQDNSQCTGELVLEVPCGHVVFDGCVYCLADAVAVADSVARATSSSRSR